MAEQIIFRRELLAAVDAFLEGTPDALERGHKIVRRCHDALFNKEKSGTVDSLVWNFYFQALTDSVFYESPEYLQEIREQVLGNGTNPLATTMISYDYRPFMTPEETEWYQSLVHLVEFISAIPYEEWHQVTAEARQNQESWETMLTYLPAAVKAEELDHNYWQQAAKIQEFAARCPTPEYLGDEKVLHLILREVTTFLTKLRVGKSAAYFGYPVFWGTNTEIRPRPRDKKELDITKNICWGQRALDALAGSGVLILSWRLIKAPTFDGDMLLVSLH